MPFDKRTLIMPQGTRFEERTVVTRGDLIVADGGSTEFGFRTDGRIFLGEGVAVGGALWAAGDVRADLFCRLAGDVEAGGSCYLGEKTRVEGKLSVAGDLDVGDDVAIADGFEAGGWINIRNPIPMVVYVFLYLLQLMGQGKSEEVERILQELETGDADVPIAVSEVFFFLPPGSTLGLQNSVVKGNLFASAECRILGNFAVEGNAVLGARTSLHGALRSDGDVRLEDGANVGGDLACRGVLAVGDGCRILGNVTARRVEMHAGAKVEGTIQAREGIKFVSREMAQMQQKVQDFREGRVEVQGIL